MLDKTPFWSKTNRDHIQSIHNLERSGMQNKGVPSIGLLHAVILLIFAAAPILFSFCAYHIALCYRYIYIYIYIYI